MSRKLICRLEGRGLNHGSVEGYALCCPDSFDGWCGVNSDGIITEMGHVHEGECIDGKIIVVPGGRGSTGWSCHVTAVGVAGHGPAGWVLRRVDARVGVALVTLGSPGVCEFPVDPFSVICDGDWLRVNADEGFVEVWREEN